LSLESKAKTYEEVYALWKEAWAKTVDGVYNPLLDQKWVRLEDCQKTVGAYEEQVFKLAVEKAELKKRLEKLRSHIDKLRKILNQGTCLSLDTRYVEIEKWVEEALKLCGS